MTTACAIGMAQLVAACFELDEAVPSGGTAGGTSEGSDGPDVAWAVAHGRDLSPRGIALDVADNTYVVVSFWGQTTIGERTFTPNGAVDMGVLSYDAAGTLRWARSIGGAGPSDRVEPSNIAWSPAGGLWITGTLSGTADFDGSAGDMQGDVSSAGGQDVFLLSLDDSGAFRSVGRFGGPGDDRGTAVVASDSAVFLTGCFHETIEFGGTELTGSQISNAFVARFDPTGSLVWTLGYTTTRLVRDCGEALAIAPNGTLRWAGTYGSELDLGAGPMTDDEPPNVFVAALDGDGKHMWSRPIAGRLGDEVAAVQSTSQGITIVAGNFHGDLNIGPANLAGAGAGDIYLAALAADGSAVWSKEFGSSSSTDIAQALAIGSDDTLHLGGRFSGRVDFGGKELVSSVPELSEMDAFVASFDRDGRSVASTSYGDVQNDEVIDLAVGRNGDLYILGTVATRMLFRRRS